MNRAFMKYMRQHRPKASRQHFDMALLKLGDNEEEAEEEEGPGKGKEEVPGAVV